MHINRLVSVGTNHDYKWPSGDVETYPEWVEYEAFDENGEHRIRIGFNAIRHAFEADRARVTVWIDNNPAVEFAGTDDHEDTGDVIAQLEVSPNDGGQLVDLSYPSEPVPERFLMFSPVGYLTRVSGARTPNCWGVVANISDHRKLAAYAAMKNLERIWRDDARNQ